MKTKFTFSLLFVLLSGLAMAQPPACPAPTPALTLNFQWSTAAGTGNEIPVRALHGNYTSPGFPSGIGGYTTTVTLRDPNNRLTIQNYQNDPLVAGTPPYTYCYSGTNGSLSNPPAADPLYSGYYLLGMFSTNSAEKVELEFLFSSAMRLCDLEISDIDYDVSCNGFCSYQDEVDITAFNGATPVPVTITPALNSVVLISGQKALGDISRGGNGDVNAGSNLGKVNISSAVAITKLVISYSNGPNDDGQSNDHHIRIGNISGSVSTNNIPVRIVDFNAINNSGVVNAALQVANQQGMDYYQLQKSVDGRNFSDVEAQKQSATAATNYNFNDVTPANGANFYRIKAKDRNGEIFYSVVKRVDIVSKLGYAVKSQGSHVVLQANTNEAAKINVSVVNAAGKSVLSSAYQLTKGVNLLPLHEMDNMPSGMYFIVVTENGVRTFTGKAVK